MSSTDKRTDRRTDKVNPVYPPRGLLEVLGKMGLNLLSITLQILLEMMYFTYRNIDNGRSAISLVELVCIDLHFPSWQLYRTI